MRIALVLMALSFPALGADVFFIAVGNQHYRQSSDPCNYVMDDVDGVNNSAHEMAEFFKRHGAVTGVLLQSSEKGLLTKDDIINAYLKLEPAIKKSKEPLLVFYYCGHGYKNPFIDRSTLVMGTAYGDLEAIELAGGFGNRAVAVSNLAVALEMRDIPYLFLIDACRSSLSKPIPMEMMEFYERGFFRMGFEHEHDSIRDRIAGESNSDNKINGSEPASLDPELVEKVAKQLQQKFGNDPRVTGEDQESIDDYSVQKLKNSNKSIVQDESVSSGNEKEVNKLKKGLNVFGEKLKKNWARKMKDKKSPEAVVKRQIVKSLSGDQGIESSNHDQTEDPQEEEGEWSREDQNELKDSIDGLIAKRFKDVARNLEEGAGENPDKKAFDELFREKREAYAKASENIKPYAYKCFALFSAEDGKEAVMADHPTNARPIGPLARRILIQEKALSKLDVDVQTFVDTLCRQDLDSVTQGVNKVVGKESTNTLLLSSSSKNNEYLVFNGVIDPEKVSPLSREDLLKMPRYALPGIAFEIEESVNDVFNMPIEVP